MLLLNDLTKSLIHIARNKIFRSTKKEKFIRTTPSCPNKQII